jgi:8-oxo-dGTP diphosphatase
MQSRTYPSYPIPGVGAIIVGNQGLLLTRRDKDPAKGLWSIPGGVVEVGETKEQAILREVEEETGIKVEVREMIGTYDLIIKDSQDRIKYHYLLIHFLTRALSSTIRPESPKVEVRWFKINQLPEKEIPPQILSLIRDNLHKIRNLQTE